MNSSSLPNPRFSSANAQWTARDRAVLWHPCTQMHDHETVPLIPISHGKGVWLHDFDGKCYLDAVSSWWTNLFGHANPRIGAAIQDQVQKLEQVMLAGFCHEPAIRLAEELIRITPPGLSKVFFADNGSSAVEIALKMSVHYWHNCGKKAKRRFIALNGSYHGETIGALSVTDIALYRAVYAPLLLEPIFVASPDCYFREEGESWEEYSRRQLDHLRQALERHAHETSAVILEPLVQCAGGMRMYHPIYLSGARKLCDEFDVHLIADEVAVGFGRTGTLFACEQAKITSDFLCLSKGLTGGFLPLSAVVTHEKIYQAFYADYKTGKAFLHSHSFTGNPLACRAALETLAIFRDEPVLENNRELAAKLTKELKSLADHPNIGEIRQTGTIAAIELVRDRRTKQPYPASERRGLRVYCHALEQGVVLRPLGNVVYFMPPYVISEEEIALMVSVAKEAIEIAVT